jgi:hypothetical protein
LVVIAAPRRYQAAASAASFAHPTVGGHPGARPARGEKSGIAASSSAMMKLWPAKFRAADGGLTK